MIVVWLAVFVVVWRSTGIPNRPCNDTVTFPAAAACVAPGPSLLPALPIATVAALTVGAISIRLWSRHPKRA